MSTVFVAEKTLPMDVIRIDGGTQSRLKVNQELVDGYAEKMADGAAFPPGVAFFDGREYWLADGFHRYHGLRKNGKDNMVCRIVNGTLREAIIYSKSANALHGMPLTMEDRKHNAIEMLTDFEWSGWGDRKIGMVCDLSRTTVAKLRESLGLPETETVKYLSSKTGKVHEQTRRKKNSPAKQVKLAEPPVAEETDKPDEKQEALEYLIEENDKLKDQLAAGTSEDPEFAKSHMEELRQELKLAKIELAAVTKSRDQFQAENAQLKKQVAYLQKQLKKAA